MPLWLKGNFGLSEMKAPFFSIIIPTYNSAKTIASSFESIINQSFTNFEVIVIDGKSSDETLSISQSYCESFRNFKIISEKDNGIYQAMNKGIEMAKGEWLYFLGSDDYLIDNSVLENLIRLGNLESHDFVYGNVLSPEYGENYDGEFDQKKILNRNICHQALFVRKKLFYQLGKFNIRYRQLADYDFNLRSIFNKKVRKKHVNMRIAYYAPAGSSSTKTDKKFIRDKNYLLLKYGFAYFNWPERIQLSKQIIKQVFAVND